MDLKRCREELPDMYAPDGAVAEWVDGWAEPLLEYAEQMFRENKKLKEELTIHRGWIEDKSMYGGSL